MNELSIRNTSLINYDKLNIESLLEDFYKSIDVGEETKRTYKKGIANFLDYLKKNNITQLDKKIMLEYKTHLINTYEPTTATTYLSGVRNLFNFLEEFGVPNLMRNIKGVKISRDFKKQPLAREQTKKILKNNKIHNP